MPYIFDSFDSGKITATSVEDNLRALRRYVNREIVANDFSLDIVQTEDLLEGDPVGATRTDFWAVSGDVHAQHGDAARVSRQYLTGTVATKADYTVTYDLDQRLPGCSKTFYLERDAIILVTVWVMVVAGESNLSNNTIDPVGDILFARTTGVVSNSDSRFFVEDPAVAVPDSGPQPAGSAMNRRPFSYTFIENQQAGSHTYSIYVNLHSEKMFVSARNMTIEVLYL